MEGRLKRDDAAIIQAVIGAMNGTAPADPALVDKLDGLFAAQQPRIYRLCLRMVGDPERAQELAQDAMLTAYRSLPGYRGDSTFSTWLYGIARNLCLNSIRRRGENISSLEVEKVVLQYPDVLDAAVIPVPSEFSEDEVMTVVEPKPGRTIDPVDLIEFLVPQMAHFMVPRYVRFMDALPKTPTNKVQKTRLREEGVTDDTWDREAAGIRLKRERLSK